MSRGKIISFALGFLALFTVYHFPEFFSAFWIMAIGKIGFLILAFILARIQGWKGLGGYGLGFSKRWLADVCKGVCMGLFFFSLSAFASILLGYEAVSGTVSFSTIIHQLPMLLLITAIPSIAEDLLTRGYLYAHIKFRKPIGWVLFSSVVYVLNHIWRLDDGPAVLTYLFTLGVVLAFAVWITQSLWLAFGIHWGANIAFEFAQTIIRTKSLVGQQAATWVLAATWALVFILLVVFRRRVSG